MRLVAAPDAKVDSRAGTGPKPDRQAQAGKGFDGVLATLDSAAIQAVAPAPTGDKGIKPPVLVRAVTAFAGQALMPGTPVMAETFPISPAGSIATASPIDDATPAAPASAMPREAAKNTVTQDAGSDDAVALGDLVQGLVRGPATIRQSDASREVEPSVPMAAWCTTCT